MAGRPCPTPAWAAVPHSSWSGDVAAWWLEAESSEGTCRGPWVTLCPPEQGFANLRDVPPIRSLRIHHQPSRQGGACL